MSHGVSGTIPFENTSDRKLFLALVAGMAQMGKLIIHAYSLLSTHFHMLAETPEGRLSYWMQQLLGAGVRS
jgi:hypothetical protein